MCKLLKNSYLSERCYRRVKLSQSIIPPAVFNCLYRSNLRNQMLSNGHTCPSHPHCKCRHPRLCACMLKMFFSHICIFIFLFSAYFFFILTLSSCQCSNQRFFVHSDLLYLSPLVFTFIFTFFVTSKNIIGLFLLAEGMLLLLL